MTEREARTENDVASGLILRISKGFHRRNYNIYIDFYLLPGIIKILKPAAHEHKVLIQFYRPPKKYSSADPVPLTLLKNNGLKN
jgi:hypothetical protein